MDCEQIRTALSARLDGEDPGIPAGALDAHLAGCAACRAWREETAVLHRALRVTPAPTVPDLSSRVLATIQPEPREEIGLRVALMAVALVQMAIAIPALVGSDAGLAAHVARHIGSLNIAIAFGLAYAAWRPSRAVGLMPVLVALVACLVGTTVLDVASGRTAAGAELTHVPELAGLALLWLLVHPRAHRSAPRNASGGMAPA
jgi:predicted anti-sigma-YlaC factor YlaD